MRKSLSWDAILRGIITERRVCDASKIAAATVKLSNSIGTSTSDANRVVTL
jgi:hypothetical protein